MGLSKAVIGGLLLLALPGALCAQTAGAPRDFVQGFYNWYIPVALKDNATPAWNLALKSKSSAFSPQLLNALREDSAAQAKAVGDIVGIDFDPFLGSQDPSNRYDVGKIIQNGDAYRVEIYGARSGKKRATPDVIADVLQKDGRWMFVNFHYPDGSDLTSVLKTLRDERQKSPQ
jgi:hypothetical protein